MKPSEQQPMSPFSQERRFGLLLALMFALIALAPLIHGGAIRIWSLSLGLLLLIVAVVWPRLLVWPCRAWMAFGTLLHHIVSPVVMGLLFFGVFTPLGALMRLMGKTPLALNRDPLSNTYWVDREQPAPAADSMKHGF